MASLETLAAQLDADPDFKKLPPQEQDTVFATLAKDIESGGGKSEYDPISVMGKALGPAMQMADPFRSIPRPNEYGPIAANAVNAFGGGIPGDIYKLISGQSIPQPTSGPGQVANVIGQGLGLAVGLPGMAYRGAGAALTKAAPRLANSMRGRATARAITGAAGGIATEVAHPDQYAGNAAGGAALNVVLPPVLDKAYKMFKKTPPGKLATDSQVEELAGTVRQAVGGGKLSAGIDFDQDITEVVNASPQTVTPIDDWIQNLKTSMKADPAFAEKIQQGLLRSAKQGNTTLQAMLVDETRAVTANGRDLQNIKQTLQSVPSIDRAMQRAYAVKSSPTPRRFDATVSDADLNLIEQISELRGRLMSSYPELAPAYEKFSSFMTDYRNLAPRLRTGSIEHTLLSKYGNAMQRQAASRILPSEILQEVDRVRSSHQLALTQMKQNKEFKQLLKKLGLGAAVGVGAGLGIGRGISGLAEHVVRNSSD